MKKLFLIALGFVIAWIAVSEIGTALWYGSAESKLTENKPLPPAEEIASSLARYLEEQGGAQVEKTEVPEVSMEILKAETGETIQWSGGLARGGAVTVIGWGDRSNVQGLENSHNPSVCMSGAGWNVSDQLKSYTEQIDGRSVEIGLWDVSRPGLKMSAYSCIVRRFQEPATYTAERTFWNSDRLKAVLAGRRDAPRLMLLVYLPQSDNRAEKNEDFEKILEAALNDSKDS